jgi:carbonic anhydrase/acetyltransferase-like protein (isoleucine patch superfamily)
MAVDLEQSGRVVAFNGVKPTLGADVFIADTARVIGRVTLGAGVSVWYGTVVRGDVHDISIGARTNLQDLTMVHVTTGRYGTFVGEDVTVGHRAVLHGCRIGDRVLIGMGAIVLDGAVIGDEAMVGAGALVTPNTMIPPGMLALGSPAKVVRPLKPEELALVRHSAPHYFALAQVYRKAEGS